METVKENRNARGFLQNIAKTSAFSLKVVCFGNSTEFRSAARIKKQAVPKRYCLKKSGFLLVGEKLENVKLQLFVVLFVHGGIKVFQGFLLLAGQVAGNLHLHPDVLVAAVTAPG